MAQTAYHLSLLQQKAKENTKEGDTPSYESKKTGEEEDLQHENDSESLLLGVHHTVFITNTDNISKNGSSIATTTTTSDPIGALNGVLYRIGFNNEYSQKRREEEKKSKIEGASQRGQQLYNQLSREKIQLLDKRQVWLNKAKVLQAQQKKKKIKKREESIREYAKIITELDEKIKIINIQMEQLKNATKVLIQKHESNKFAETLSEINGVIQEMNDVSDKSPSKLERVVNDTIARKVEDDDERGLYDDLNDDAKDKEAHDDLQDVLEEINESEDDEDVGDIDLKNLDISIPSPPTKSTPSYSNPIQAKTKTRNEHHHVPHLNEEEYQIRESKSQSKRTHKKARELQ